MRKFLVVGCGGSGGATLSYMMDQLRSELALKGVDRIPDGWQFIHIDVPVGDQAQATGVASVRNLGGAYYGTGVAGVSYAVMDGGVSQILAQNNGLGSIATWAPRSPEEVIVAISAGAGQYRAVGRMITLSKPAGIRSALEAALSNLSKVETETEMAELARKVPSLGAFEPEDPPIVLVVSSMAGGAGASMAIDVCRLLSLIPQVNPDLLGVFMVSADLFDSLPDAARTGVRANALAMLGEIVATQTGAAREHDVATLAALGAANGAGDRVPFKRVFPVGRFVGAGRTQFGDGSAQAVYRGLGRGLAAMMSSGVATRQFVEYDLTNTGSPTADKSFLGWGEDWDPLPWGSFGFASLSMGRERYREYAAQRLARTSVDRLLAGHMQEGSAASSNQQIDMLLTSQWARVCTQLGLPGDPGRPLTPQELFEWFVGTAFTRDDLEATARALVETQLTSNIPSPAGIPAAQWLPTLKARLRDRRATMVGAVSQAAHQWAYGWQQQFVEKVTAVVEEAVATFGMPYASAVVDRIEAHLKNVVVKGLEELGNRGPQEISALPPAFEAKVSAIRGAIANAGVIVDELTTDYRKLFRDSLAAQSASLASQILATSTAGLTGPLREALTEGHHLLQQAKDSATQHVGLAHLATDIYTAWPSDGDLAVPERFDVANNEVLLTKSAEFPAQYMGDVTLAVQAPGEESIGFTGARAAAVGQIIAGTWATTGAARPPRGLVTQESLWRTAVFAVNPLTNEVEVPSNARFTVHVKPAEVLSRARLFVLRPMESFDRFCNLSLGDFVKGVGANGSEVVERQQSIASKFREALTLARPLISVNPTAVQTLHMTEMVYRYKFSNIPFKTVPSVVEQFTGALENASTIDSSSLKNLEDALSDTEGITKIDIFGSYPNYSPLAFNSILEPVAKEWMGMPAQGREGFWKWRRSRPLAAALPMGTEERQAMVGGWFVGQIVGQIRIPEAPFSNPVEIWDREAGRWTSFPNPLLTPPTSKGFVSYDWLPAVMESILVAMARSHEVPVMGTLRPYRVLRELYDAGSQGPAAGLSVNSAKTLLASWLDSGTTEGGAPSRVPGIAAGQTPQERAELTRTWLSGIEKLAGEQFLAPGVKGAPGGGQYSSITSRVQAASIPIFHDLAPDVYVRVKDISALLDEALQLALTGGAASAAAPAQAPLERLDDYTAPEGGVF